MSFKEIFKSTPKIEESPYDGEILNEKNKPSQDAEKVLRKAGYKIKLVTPTSFGVQIDFARQYNQSEIEKVLDGYNVKSNKNSIFVLN